MSNFVLETARGKTSSARVPTQQNELRTTDSAVFSRMLKTKHHGKIPLAKKVSAAALQMALAVWAPGHARGGRLRLQGLLGVHTETPSGKRGIYPSFCHASAKPSVLRNVRTNQGQSAGTRHHMVLERALYEHGASFLLRFDSKISINRYAGYATKKHERSPWLGFSLLLLGLVVFPLSSLVFALLAVCFSTKGCFFALSRTPLSRAAFSTLGVLDSLRASSACTLA